ncbi:hypothetical protein GYMLUDRAFT_85974 [Collybiopsis luxurians FD-317 M1]|uniref:Major facilitator superfamily (MFS) profile domain-containing protein n=1 Tax=Collybiopsis luxurians FD-317 M1 TaxID=944289 RepID=A0A0D0CLC1_9AGAR|nr:hypothetical protein GYMLUDRAFT_85974 [Collybiopsis luxurians FD-317 M1]
MDNAGLDSHERHPSHRSTSERLGDRLEQALEAMNTAPLSFHVKVCFVAGIGFFTDAYDIFAISIASTMLGSIYGPAPLNPNTLRQLTPNQDLGIKIATPVGTVIGQLLFGWLADHVGRKKTYGLELVLIIFTNFAQAIAGGGPAINVIGTLILWRFLMGLGVGGDYPISAVIASEFASAESRGRSLVSVFSAQGLGQLDGYSLDLAASIVALIVTSAFKDSMITNPDVIDYAWRILIGVGCIPGVIALYFRLTVPETPRFTLDVERNIEQAARDIENALSIVEPADPLPGFIPRPQTHVASWADFKAFFGQWKNMKILLSAGYSWFALDIAVYGLGLNIPIILRAVGFNTGGSNSSESLYVNLRNVSVGNLILTVAGLIPGYVASFFLIDRWGRKPIQFMGFCVLTVLYIGMGFAYGHLKQNSGKVFFALYCIAGFFQNFGPNTTTFVVPAEVFPTRYRSTAHGIAAASGKLGAVIAEAGFARLQNHGGPEAFLGHILEICAFFMLTGVVSTLFIPETKCRTLEDLSSEENGKLQRRGNRDTTQMVTLTRTISPLITRQ